jgi:hypothetical protein
MDPSCSASSRNARVALIAIALCAFSPIVSAAGAPTGTTPPGAVGDALRSWIDTHAASGVELEGVYFGEHDGIAGAYRAGGTSRRDVGVFAAAGGLDAGEAYVSVPWSLVLSAETVGAHRPELGKLLTRLRAEYGSDDKSALMLALIHERFSSFEDSPWRDYLAALPDPDAPDANAGFDAPLYWDTASLRELQGSDVLDDAIADQAKVRAVHKGFSRRVFLNDDETHALQEKNQNENENQDKTVLFPPPSRTLAATKWAWSVTHSRASNVPGKGLALVPLADMINDRDGADATDAAAAEENAADDNAKRRSDFVVYDARYRRAAVYAKRAYRPGEEIFESYGAWSDADTLLSAGYLRDLSGTFGTRGNDSKRDKCVTVLLAPGGLPETALNAAARALRDHGFEVPWRACLDPGMRGTRAAKRVAKWASIVAENAMFDARGRTGENERERGSAGDGSGSRSEKSSDAAAFIKTPGGARGGDALLRALDDRLAGYPTSIEEDEDALRLYREALERIVFENASTLETQLEKTRLRRAVLATELRRREKRTLSATRSSVAIDAGGDVFVWADVEIDDAGDAPKKEKDEL